MKFKNFKKKSEMIGFDGEYPPRQPSKKQILTFVLENCQKSALKHSIEKPI